MSATTAVEEIAAYLSILAILFFVIVVPFRRVIAKLNERLPWKGHFFPRLGIQGMVVVSLSILLGLIFGELIHLYIDHVLPTGVVILRTILFLLITSSLIMGLLEVRNLHDQKDLLRLRSHRLEKEVVESLYNSLKQQVNPHFLFNSLSVLSSLVRYDPQKAERFIEHFAEVYRYVLDMNTKKMVSLAEEQAFLDSYLFLQKIRHGDHLEIVNELPADISSYRLPPLTLQLIFENIFKHNVIDSKNPMKIKMRLREQQLEIINEYRPRQVTRGAGLGQNNLIAKYRALGFGHPSFRISDGEYQASVPVLKSGGT